MNEPARRIFLVRHGATESNLRRPYVLQGQRTDLPLAEPGRRQAQAAAAVLAHCPIQLVASSPLGRARETAELLAAPHRLQVQVVEAFTECDVGTWEGVSWETVRAHDHVRWSAFIANPGTEPYPSGESFQQVQDRALPALRGLVREQPHGDIIVVTHNVVARVILADLIGLHINLARNIRVDNGGISVITVTDDTLKVETQNSVFHLAGL